MTSADSSHKSPGLVLGLSGPEERLQLVLGQPGSDGCRLLASREWTVPGNANRHLLPGLKEMLDGLGYTMGDIGKVACTRGPGSFTGMRLVLAAAEGLAAGCDAKPAGIDYLPLLASGPATIANGILHVVTYARRGLVYLQSFNLPSLHEAHSLCSLPLDDAASAMDSMSDTAYLMGSGLRKNQDFFLKLGESNPGYTLLPAAWDNPSPELLLQAADRAECSDAIEPVYVRASDAEDNLAFIAQKRGLDPDEAKQRLKELQQQ